MIRLVAALLFLAFPAVAQTPVVRTELSADTVVVGQPLVLRVTVLVPTWMPDPPSFPSVEAPNLIVRLPERASGPVSERIGSETWSGVSRAYRLYPMVQGDFTVPSQAVALTYADPQTREPVDYEVQLDPVSFIATVPEGAEGLDPLIIAEGLTLEQSFDAADGPLAQGDAVIRNVTATIEGTSPLFIPPLVPAVVSEAVQAYPKDPAVADHDDRGALSGSRRESVTYVAQYGGTVDLPAITLRWFDIGSNRVETAKVEGRMLTVDAPPRPVAPKITRRQVALLVGGMLVLGVVAWAVARYAVPPLRAWRAERRAAWLASEGFAARQVEAAVAARDLSATLRALALWSGRCPGDDGVLEAALAGVGAARFGSESAAARDAGWPDLRKAFRAERARRLAVGQGRRSALPPLNPT